MGSIIIIINNNNNNNQTSISKARNVNIKAESETPASLDDDGRYGQELKTDRPRDASCH